MIRRFSTLYVGHIELEHCGLDGTPAELMIEQLTRFAADVMPAFR